MKPSSLLFSVVLSLSAAVPALAAVDGAAQFRVDTNGIFGFAYQTDSTQPGVVATEFWENGTSTGTLTRQADGSWAGRLGMQVIVSTKAEMDKNGKQLDVRIVSNPGGIFDYTIQKNKKGGIEISGMSPHGDLTLASISSDGAQLTVDGVRFLLGVNENGKKPDGKYNGSVLPTLNRDGDPFDASHGGIPRNPGALPDPEADMGTTASLTAQGTLYPPAVFNADQTLYLLLYVLPFHESRWPARI